jgi:hypothetical protein
MVNLEAVKRNLHHISPKLYANAYRLYQATPYARHRNARIGKEVSEKLRARVEYESRIVREYLNDDWTVRHGPFAGMKYVPITSGSLLSPKVIGSYESPIHRWIIDAIDRNYETILNIGCGEGYYAVGFSLRSKALKVYAYDVEKQARENVAALAHLNGTADRVHIRDLCTIDELRQEVTNRTLIFCDIEGGEFDLFRPDLIPELSRADLIVETHDYIRPGVTETLVHRFLPSHRIEITYHCAKYAEEFPILGAIPTREHALLLEEGRPRTQGWMRLLANLPGAIEPGQWWGERDGRG